MPPTDVNARIAREVMGWKLTQDADGQWWFEYPLIGKRKTTLPDFEDSLDACAIAEAEIERRGRMEDYSDAIFRRWLNGEGSHGFTRLLIRLTPTQRCAAMLKAVTHDG